MAINELFDDNKETRELIEKLKESCSACPLDQEEFARKFIKEFEKVHRTVQQLMMKMFSNIIRKYAELNRSDPRNHDSLEWAKKVSQLKNDFRFI